MINGFRFGILGAARIAPKALVLPVAKLASEGRALTLKPINITVQYLSAGLMKRTYALGRITRLGRRTANIAVEAWQDDREKLVATAIMNIVMSK